MRIAMTRRTLARFRLQRSLPICIGLALSTTLLTAIWGIASAGAETQPASGRSPVHVFPLPPTDNNQMQEQRLGGPDGFAEGKGFLGRRCESGYCPTVPLYWNGGRVQHAPKVYAIFWGSNWNSLFGSGTKNAVKSMYEGLSGSAWQGILTQYFDASGNVGSGVSVSTYVDTSVVAPSSVNEQKITEEVASAIKANGWVREPDAQFVVLPAPTTTYQAGFGSGFCGYHGVDSSGSSYSFVPYMGDSPFSLNCPNYDPHRSYSHVTSMVASHEYAESATDPIPSLGWIDSEGFENADICASGDDQLPNGTWVQGTWDNYENACSLSDFSPPQVYARTEPVTNIGTTEATLNGLVNPEGRETTGYFKWGGVVLQNETGKVPVGSGRNNVTISTTITGLKSGETYLVTAVASNSTGTFKGSVLIFTTK